MKKLLLMASLAMMGLSGCYALPHHDRDDGYRNGRDHRDDRHDRHDRDGRGDDRYGGYGSQH